MDVVSIIVIIGLVVFLFTNKKNFFYFFGSVDILLRILCFIKTNVEIAELSNLISKYFPESIEGIINLYSSGIIETILIWVYFGCYVLFEIYLVKLLLKKR